MRGVGSDGQAGGQADRLADRQTDRRPVVGLCASMCVCVVCRSSSSSSSERTLIAASNDCIAVVYVQRTSFYTLIPNEVKRIHSH